VANLFGCLGIKNERGSVNQLTRLPSIKAAHSIFSIALVSSLLLAACGGGGGKAPTPTVSLSPREITDRSAKVMLAVNSLHFLIERNGVIAYLDEEEVLGFKRAEGDFEQPDRVRTKIRIVTEVTPFDIAFIALGDEQYVTDPLSGGWRQIPPEWGFNPAIIFDSEVGILKLLQEGLENLSLVGSDKIDGLPHYRLAGQVNAERIREMSAGLIGRGQVRVEIWIGADDFYMRQAHLVEPETDPQDPTTWEFRFSAFNEPIEIQAPSEVIPEGE